MKRVQRVQRVQRVLIVGGGSAGLLTALTMRRFVPDLVVQLVHSSAIPVIGVGESTTWALPQFLHHALGLERGQFYREVRPSWKLGIRFEWGVPEDTHFNYSFRSSADVLSQQMPRLHSFYCLDGLTDTSDFDALMERGLSPCALRNGKYVVDEGGAYHIENRAFVGYLGRRARELGVEFIDAEVQGVAQTESGDVSHIELKDGRSLAADLFVDCSGFRSLLLGETLKQPYVSYRDSLFCDRAVVGSYARDGAIMPYTTTETMDHGWCWKIEFFDKVTRGYVYSSDHCSDDEAREEMLRKNPQLDDDLKVIKFRCGRYENHWVKNVAAIGNAYGFVEPLEATALHLIIEQARFLCTAIRDSQGQIVRQLQDLENRRSRWLWDDVRDFLAVHYRFNRRLETPFWKRCNEEADLCGATDFVDYYRHAGPTGLSARLLYDQSIFGFEGYLVMMAGQRVPSEFRFQWTSAERKLWDAYRKQIRANITGAIPVREGLERVYAPSWVWPRNQ